MGLFLLVELDGSLLGVAMNPLIGDLGEPCPRDFVEMLEGREAPSIEEIGF